MSEGTWTVNAILDANGVPYVKHADAMKEIAEAYRRGFAAGLSAAVKVCEERSLSEVTGCEATLEASYCANDIRAIPDQKEPA